MANNRTFKLSCLSLAIGGTLGASPIWAAEADNQDAANRSGYYQPAGVSQMDFGGVGLWQMPTARMADNGEFSASYRDNQEYRRYAISLQPLDWLEATLRYTDIRTRPYSNSPGFSGNQTYKDKSFDVKARLWQESRWLPQVSLGLRDIAGTGLFDSEYLVASKRWGPFDFTLGMGWGNMAQSGNITNPACRLASGFCTRTASTTTGQFAVKNFFHGPAALFAGLEYQTPWDPLRVKLEYDGNDYSQEAADLTRPVSQHIKQDSPINVGLVYRATDWLDTSLSWERGNTLMWGFTLRTNFNHIRPQHPDDEPPVYLPANNSQSGTDWQRISRELDDKAGFAQPDIYADDNQVTVVADQYKYPDDADASRRAATVLANNLPDNVTDYHIVTRSGPLTTASTHVDAAGFRQLESGGTPLGLDEPNPYRTEPLSAPHGRQVLHTEPPRLSYGIDPALQQSFGGPESFYMYQLSANASADYRITDNWRLGGTVNVNLLNNYDRFNFTSPPQDGAALPRVRTHIREYVTASDVLLTNLQLSRYDHPARDWYTQVYGGYLEMMYAGVGGEVLYRPFGSNWAVGMDVNYVKQRDWDSPQSLRDYSVTTGHLTTYWSLPFIKGGLAKISVGRYLAGDKGVTLDLSRRFDSGIVAGAFATVTNVSASEYGEGSFTKGIYFTIPFDVLFSSPTTRRGSIGWVPLTRDGGQMLDRRDVLYNMVERE
ncbi:protein of unknown function DUF940 membrane lipoprotein putative [Dickeya chrysanthemi Ech1591]|uniref:Lipoprotein n=1 Tax=Dickeya chrysanthemi (strain Ech1591) TaxID=561229 RepID=C6CNZ0_DICC1|nr:YjbH domain-containing protein [Dickeya chrysanthemi]ACT07665.1 protein of unknown function DUF940 membrane lipoprotein putative [Dickeya chrysanthemi Ech1591]